jgi:hypothetical protein
MRGAGVVGINTYPSIPNTSLNGMRPRRPSWTSPLTKVNRPHLFAACCAYPNLRHVGFCSLAFQEHHPCLRRELSCYIHTPANPTSRTELGTHANKSPEIRLCGELMNIQLGMSARAMPKRGA